jgi:hypothetical protein
MTGNRVSIGYAPRACATGRARSLVLKPPVAGGRAGIYER